MAERKKLYKSTLSETEFWEKLSFLIQVESKDKLGKHIKKFNPHRHEKIFGRIEEDNFWIWKHGLLSGGMFYPIFYGQIMERQKNLVIQMNAKPNSMGGLFFIFLSFLLVVAIVIWLLFIQEYSSTLHKAICATIAIFIFLLFQAAPNITYTISKRNFRIFLEQELKMERIN